MYIIIALSAAAMLLAALFFGVTYKCFRMAFAVPKKYRIPPDDIPNFGQYKENRRKMLDMVHTADSIPFERVTITARDGTRLSAKYYHTADGAPLQILFHGYRSNSIRDFCGGLVLSLDAGCNALLVDQRAHGESGGKFLSFGIFERYDCLDWINYALERFGGDTKIILTGISMGAATVTLASGLELPPNVVGIIADSGYDSPSNIIRKVITESRYPTRTAYSLVRLGGRIFGGFDIESVDSPSALATATVPVLFIHGEGDDFVPCSMTLACHAACASEKYLFTVPEAAHGISYVLDTDGYYTAAKAFIAKVTQK